LTNKKRFLCFLNPEKTFIIFGVLFGILFAIITPPFQVPDEYNHFYRAFQISEFKIIAERKQNLVGGLLPESLKITADKVSQGIPFHPEIKQKPEKIISLLNLPLASDKRVFLYFPNTSLYSPIPYLPQTIGIAIGKIMKLSPIVLMYMGRISNLLFWVFLIYLSIKKTPLFKWMFFLLALTPMSLFEAASLSADAVTNGLSFLLISAFLHYAFLEYQKINLINISTLSLLISLSKTGYFPLILLYLLIPIKKLGNRRKYFTVFASLVLLNFGAIALWSLLIKGLYVPLQPHVSPKAQLLFILASPLEFLKVMIETVLVHGGQLLKEFIGLLGWIDTRLPLFQIYSYFIILFFVAVVVKEKNIVINFHQKLILFCTFLFNLTIILVLLYLSWTSVGGHRIAGLLGRYFTPIFPLFFLLFYNHKKFGLNLVKISQLVTVYSLFSNTLTVCVLLHRYYF
jgi:uncharacterized membrane protein